MHQHPGLNQVNLDWMVLEAQRRQLTQDGMSGVLIFDEMQIQVRMVIALFLKSVGQFILDKDFQCNYSSQMKNYLSKTCLKA